MNEQKINFKDLLEIEKFLNSKFNVNLINGAVCSQSKIKEEC